MSKKAAKKAAQAAEPTDAGEVAAAEPAEPKQASKPKSGVRYAVYQLHQGSYRVNTLLFERGHVYEISPELGKSIESAKPAPPLKVFNSREDAEANIAALEAQRNPKPTKAA